MTCLVTRFVEALPIDLPWRILLPPFSSDYMKPQVEHSPEPLTNYDPPEATAKHLSWIPNPLSTLALSLYQEFCDTDYDGDDNCSLEVAEWDLDLRGMKNEKKLVIKLIPEVCLFLKVNSRKVQSIGVTRTMAFRLRASASVPVVYAILAAYQFRWFVTQLVRHFVRCSWTMGNSRCWRKSALPSDSFRKRFLHRERRWILKIMMSCYYIVGFSSLREVVSFGDSMCSHSS